MIVTTQQWWQYWWKWFSLYLAVSTKLPFQVNECVVRRGRLPPFFTVFSTLLSGSLALRLCGEELGAGRSQVSSLPAASAGNRVKRRMLELEEGQLTHARFNRMKTNLHSFSRHLAIAQGEVSKIKNRDPSDLPWILALCIYLVLKEFLPTMCSSFCIPLQLNILFFILIQRLV